MTEAIQLTPLDHHFADFINRLDSASGDELWLTAALASEAAGRGHICLDLAEYAGREILPFHPAQNPLRTPSAEQWRKALAGRDTVGRAGDYTPLVLDDAGRLYLHRFWEYERRVAEGILSRLAPLAIDHGRLRTLLDRYFPPQGDGIDWQRAAATAAATRHFTVISGGPGTGKTTTVARILALLIELEGELELSISLAAPTGKAAMRLRQSIAQAAVVLDLPETVRPRMPDQVRTIHRLLGGIPGSGSFRHNRDNRLPCDLLVVDEVSMVDLPLMARLLEALSDGTRVIMLGDQDQLASVEAGAVLADICNHGCQRPFSTEFRRLVEGLCGPLPPETYITPTDVPRPPPNLPLEGGGTKNTSPDILPPLQGEGRGGDGVIHSTISDSIMHLTTSYRFSADSGIGGLSRLINSGDGAAALDLLQSGATNDLSWRPLPAAGAFDAAFSVAAIEGYRHYLGAATPGAALAELENFRILSPHRDGIYGVENLNRLAEAALGMRRQEGESWFPHLPVMVIGNNYELELFNGDTAVLMDNPESGRLTAFFPHLECGVRHLSPLRLPAHETAFALTVHRSQGSEFGKVLLILPERLSEVLSRELLYTAVTRARTKVEIWGTEEVFCRAVERRVERSSGLRERLWG